MIYRSPACDEHGSLIITIPAVLAGAAHLTGEESEVLLFLAARAVDRAGSGRVEQAQVLRHAGGCWSRKQLDRIVNGPKGARYWDVEGVWLRLRGQAAVLESFEGEILPRDCAIEIAIVLLDTRARRGAALLAAALATEDGPRSWEFIARFTGVNRKTVARWQRDPVIRDFILTKVPTWTT